jgi:hypothetical protein
MRFLTALPITRSATWANENCGKSAFLPSIGAGCSDASKGGSSPCSLSLRVAPVPLRAFDPPSAPSDPGRRSAPRNGPSVSPRNVDWERPPFCLSRSIVKPRPRSAQFLSSRARAENVKNHPHHSARGAKKIGSVNGAMLDPQFIRIGFQYNITAVRLTA